MCFPTASKKGEDELEAVYLPDGSINDSGHSITIPENILEHTDNPFLNIDINSEDAVLGFIYESGNEVTIVYTSEEAEEYCDPFADDNTEANPFSDSETNPFSDTENYSIDPPLCGSDSNNNIDTDVVEKQTAYKDLLWYIELSQQQVIADEIFDTHEITAEDHFYGTELCDG